MFYDCHKISDSNAVTNEQIDKLGKKNKTMLHLENNIKAFMLHYRETFPTSTVLPKMHLLEAHVSIYQEVENRI